MCYVGSVAESQKNIGGEKKYFIYILLRDEKIAQRYFFYITFCFFYSKICKKGIKIWKNIFLFIYCILKKLVIIYTYSLIAFSSSQNGRSAYSVLL